MQPLATQLIVAQAAGENGGIWEMLTGSGPVVKLVLLILIALSVWTWAIIGLKLALLRKINREDASFLELFWNSRKLDHIAAEARGLDNSVLAGVFRTSYRELERLRRQAKPQADEATLVELHEHGNAAEVVRRAAEREAAARRRTLERDVPFLATVASAAPFIGLFGTVWGIMNAFRDIGAVGSASLAVVAPGISEALIATATGLAAAIPAVIAYNALNTRIDAIEARRAEFVEDFLDICERHFL